jgi:hypothetical protein
VADEVDAHVAAALHPLEDPGERFDVPRRDLRDADSKWIGGTTFFILTVSSFSGGTWRTSSLSPCSAARAAGSCDHSWNF